MTLRTKTLCIVTGSLLTFLLAVLLLFRFTVFNTFRQLERDVSTFQTQSVSDAMRGEIASLNALARDWCLRRELQGDLPNALPPQDTNFVTNTGLNMTTHRLDLVAVLDAQGTLLFGNARDGLDESTERQPDSRREDQFKTFATACQKHSFTEATAGLALLQPDTPILVAIQPVQRENNHPTEWLILARTMVTSDTYTGATQKHFALTLTNRTDTLKPIQSDSDATIQSVVPSGYDIVTGRIPFTDALSGNTLLLVLDMPRSVYAKGVLHSVVMSVSLVSIGLIFVVFTLWMLNRHVLSRLTSSIRHLRSGLHALTLDADLERGLDTPTNDEFDALAEAINNLLSALREAHTTSRQQQDKLQQSEKLASLGTLVSGVAHEINTPNNYINLNAEMLERRIESIFAHLDIDASERGDITIGQLPYPDAKIKILEMVRAVRDGGKAIERIVRDLKVFSRQDSDAVPEAICINDVVQRSLRMLDTDLQKATQHLTVDLDESNPHVMGNAHRLDQVLTNLIQNAAQALNAPSQPIHIRTLAKPEDRVVEVTVSDGGVGMPEHVLARIRDPFFTTKRDSHGTGLGLYVASTIIERHKGVLHIDSQFGSGTNVTVRLPAAASLTSSKPQQGA
ncbi:MAG: signal transduction histidine kinase [Candidatus Promineifilaceae bacterium]|jgi:signal transduction histidine kinase